MKKYVYMISYEDSYRCDQIECDSIKDLKTQLKFLKQDNAIVKDVKMVKNEDRWSEEEVSFSLFEEIKSMLGYRPVFMTSRRKGQKAEV